VSNIFAITVSGGNCKELCAPRLNCPPSKLKAPNSNQKMKNVHHRSTLVKKAETKLLEMKNFKLLSLIQ
jgi:hypothetical protein